MSASTGEYAKGGVMLFRVLLMAIAMLGYPLRAPGADAAVGSSVMNELMEQLPPVVESIREHNAMIERRLNRDAPPLREPSVPVTPAGGYAALRDPFAVTSLMLQEQQTHGDALRFTPLSAAGGAAPQLTLRGVINGKNGARLALLDVAGSGVYLVREGDSISLHRATGNTVIKVKEVSHLSLLVEIGTLGEVIVVR